MVHALGNFLAGRFAPQVCTSAREKCGSTCDVSIRCRAPNRAGALVIGDVLRGLVWPWRIHQVAYVGQKLVSRVFEFCSPASLRTECSRGGIRSRALPSAGVGIPFRIGKRRDEGVGLPPVPASRSPPLICPCAPPRLERVPVERARAPWECGIRCDCLDLCLPPRMAFATAAASLPP